MLLGFGRFITCFRVVPWLMPGTDHGNTEHTEKRGMNLPNTINRRNHLPQINMKRLIILLSLICIFSTALSAQPRRPVSSAAPPPPKAETGSEDDPLADFPDNGLPEPAVLGLRPSAALARSVAPKIIKNESESLSILIAALQKAGFYIIDTNQKILYRPTSTPIGAAFYDFEVAGMLRTTGFGAVTTVETLANLITNTDPDLTKVDLPKLILNDLRAARSSQDPQTQFIAELIFELGRGTSDLSTAGPAEARINLIQASLIERIFLGDLLDAFETFSEQNASWFPVRRPFELDRSVQFVSAAWRFSVPTPCEEISDVSKLAGMEGKFKKVAGKFFDKESIPSILTGPKDFIKKKFAKLAKGIEHANVINSYAKVVIANMNMNADIVVEDPVPLIRTKSDRASGEQRIVTAKFRIDFKRSETINCVGKAVKTVTGLDVSVPKDGPLKNVPVKWQPVLEGTGYSRYTGYPVFVDALDRGDISRQVTNNLGENKIKLTGKPQAQNLEQDPLVPMGKKAALTVAVATENMNASEDIPKIFWFGFEGDFGLKAFIKLAPDILAKMALKTFKVSVPVRDWQPCSEDWGGFINYTKTLRRTTVVKATRTSNGNSTGDGIRRIEKDETVNVVLNPRTPEDVAAQKARRPADFRVRGRYLYVFDGTREGDPCCGPQEGSYTTKFRSGNETTFFKSFQEPFDVRFSGGDRDYSLSFNFATSPIETRVHDFFEILDTNCPLEYADEKSEYENSFVSLTDMLPDGRYGQRFVNTAGDLLQGTKQVQATDGSTVTWEWALARCKK